MPLTSKFTQWGGTADNLAGALLVNWLSQRAQLATCTASLGLLMAMRLERVAGVAVNLGMQDSDGSSSRVDHRDVSSFSAAQFDGGVASSV